MLTLAAAAQAQQITIATVNNGDMIRMQALSGACPRRIPTSPLNGVTLEENMLRQNVIHRHRHHRGGQYVGTYEVPIWGARRGGSSRWTNCRPNTRSTTSCRRSAAG